MLVARRWGAREMVGSPVSMVASDGRSWAFILLSVTKGGGCFSCQVGPAFWIHILGA